jgi:hypothetical protein
MVFRFKRLTINIRIKKNNAANKKPPTLLLITLPSHHARAHPANNKTKKPSEHNMIITTAPETIFVAFCVTLRTVNL